MRETRRDRPAAWRDRRRPRAPRRRARAAPDRAAPTPLPRSPSERRPRAPRAGRYSPRGYVPGECDGAAQQCGSGGGDEARDLHRRPTADETAERPIEAPFRGEFAAARAREAHVRLREAPGERRERGLGGELSSTHGEPE